MNITNEISTNNSKFIFDFFFAVKNVQKIYMCLRPESSKKMSKKEKGIIL